MNVEKYLAEFFKGTKNPSLKAMEFFMEELEHPEETLKVIHVAGTNGKGSSVEMIASILKEEGYLVGKFMSPHLIKYNERISINGIEISDSEMKNLIKRLDQLVKKYQQHEGEKITLFELETTMALLYFYEKQVDFVILETGLGVYMIVQIL